MRRGQPQGCTFIGKAYYGGEGVKKDYKKAAEFYKKSCDQNHPTGCMLLGILYEDGLGAQRDLQTAKKYYSKVCQIGENLGCKLYKEAK